MTNQQVIKLEGYESDLSTDDVQYLSNYFDKMRSSPVSMAPLVCKASKCEFYKKCPLAQRELPLPMGKPCPVEHFFISQWTHDLIEELDIDTTNRVDMAQISDLVRYQLQKWRLDGALSNSTTVVEKFRGFDQSTGQAVYEDAINPIYPQFEKITKAEAKILTSLIATRDAKSKDKSRESVSMADVAAFITSRVAELSGGKMQALMGNLDKETSKRQDALEVDYDVIVSEDTDL